jgi:peptidoglycan/xylan/chitin deacetylase (PgdA/CDA1 family)
VASGAALTFDDGPDPAGTPAVLDALDAVGVKATFFLVGEQLMRNHAIARDAAARGHELALHGFEHVEHDSLRPQAARDDIARGLGSFEAATGRKPRFFRPPYGRFSEASYDACRHLGLEPVYWSSWGMDWEAIGADRIADLVSRDLRDGAVVLLHDSPRYGHRPDARPTADAIAAIASYAAERGVRLAPLGELAAA